MENQRKRSGRTSLTAFTGWLTLAGIIACVGSLVLLLNHSEPRRAMEAVAASTPGVVYGVGFCWLVFAVAGALAGLVAQKGSGAEAKPIGLVRVFALTLALAIPLLALLYALREHLR